MITLAPANPTSTTLTWATCSTSTVFVVPISADALRSLLRKVLANPETREAGEGAVRVDRVRDGLRVHCSNAHFAMPYPHLFPILLGGDE